MTRLQDPVCGMTVEESSAVGTATVAGVTYGFCSDACRRAFEADPARYAGSSAGAAGKDFEAERHEPPRTTSGRFTAPKFGSAGSGGAEFEPAPERHGRDRS
jgi:YHS domain-containing protein